MRKMSNIKKNFNFLACVLLALAMALSFLSFTVDSDKVNAEDANQYPIKVDVPDGQFNQKSSSVLNSSSSWTGNYIGNYKGSVIKGIIDLGTAGTSEKFMDETKLDKYEEYSEEMPLTPFGKNTDDNKQNWYFPGTNTCVLMINTNDTDNKRGTAYGFASTPIELNANSFYRFSFWVKTGDFAQDSGAVIKLSGFDYDIGFWNIDTSEENGLKVDAKSDEMRGFREYIIYVATSGNTVSAVINLQVGDNYTYGNVGDDDYFTHVNPSSGYAFFDNVTCYELSANDYYIGTRGIKSSRTLVYDFNTSVKVGANTLLNVDGSEIGSFKNGLNGWTRIFAEDRSSGQPLFVGTYNAGKSFNKNNIIGLESDPYTPQGNSSVLDDRNILVISSKTDSNAGVESGEFTVKSNKFYKLSAWVNTQGFDENSNASMVVVGESNMPNYENKLEPGIINDLEGNATKDARYGWKRYSFFLKGSVLKDYKAKIQLWLGYNKNCKGTVLFDDVRFEEVSYTYFNNNSSGGTLVTFDKEPSSTIENGKFFKAENYGDDYPLKPVEWTSIGKVPEGAASGTVLTNEEHFKTNAKNYLNLRNPIVQDPKIEYNSVDYPSMLLLASNEPAYFGYVSPSLSISNNNCYKISVTLMTVDSPCANLWIEVDGMTISSIKNIDTKGVFRTYDFYIQGDTPFTSGTGTDYTAKLNIALGTEQNKAIGAIFVLEAASSTIEQTEFDEKYEQFRTERYDVTSYDMYSFSKYDFFGYDRTDNNAIKQSTNWSVVETAISGEDRYTAGVFDPHHKENNEGDAYIPYEITKAYDALDPEKRFDNIFTLQVRDSAATAQLVNPIKFDANSYYMVKVTMAVALDDGKNSSSSYGAGINLTNSPYNDVEFTDIKTTSNLINKYEFRTYQFYVETNDSDNTVYLRISLGDPDFLNRHVSGEVYVAYFEVEKLNSSDDSIEESETLKIIDKHVEPTTDEENSDAETDDGHDHENENADQEGENTTQTPPNDSEKWWLIPSILFGVAIVLAVVGSIIRAIVDKRSRKQTTKQLSSYDRRYGYTGPDEDESDSFDDDKTIETKPVIVQDIDEFNDDDESSTSDNTKEQDSNEKSDSEKSDKLGDVNDDFDE